MWPRICGVVGVQRASRGEERVRALLLLLPVVAAQRVRCPLAVGEWGGGGLSVPLPRVLCVTDEQAALSLRLSRPARTTRRELREYSEIRGRWGGGSAALARDGVECD